jgi:hypothetical protein
MGMNDMMIPTTLNINKSTGDELLLVQVAPAIHA